VKHNRAIVAAVNNGLALGTPSVIGAPVAVSSPNLLSVNNDRWD
jgi:hypothetical protein